MRQVGRFIRTELRFLSFRQSPIASEDRTPFLICALALTWLAGLGRYWDHPSAEIWQFAGLGSLAYVFVLAALLWLIVAPLQPRGWTYFNVLLFVCMTSPPAILYAIPVERMMSFDAARETNFWFLLVVASWRVALLIHYLAVAAKLGYGHATIAAALPLVLILVALSALNLEHATFQLMAVGGGPPPTTHDAAFGVVVTLAVFSTLAVFPLLAAYLLMIIMHYRKRRQQDATSDRPTI